MIITIVTLSSVLLYVSIYKINIKEHFTELVLQNNVQTTNSLSSEIRERFITINVLVSSINSALNTIDNTDLDLVDSYFENQLSESTVDLDFIITDEDGEVYYTYPENQSIIGNDESHKEYFDSDISVNDILWSKPYRSNSTGEEKISIFLKGETHYLIVNLNLDYFEYIYNLIITDDFHKELLIVDSYGIIIYDSSSENDDIQLPLTNFDSIKSENDDDDIFYLNYLDDNYIATKKVVEYTDWTLILFEDHEYLSSFTGYIEKQLIFFNTFIILTYIAIIALSIFLFRKKVNTYYEGLNEMSKGNLNVTFDDSRVRILDNLAEKLNYTVSKLNDYTSEINKIAYFDNLTGIFNRESLKKNFWKLDNSETYQVIHINLRRFTLINESYGYDFGNKTLIEFTKILSTILDDTDLFGRIENDKFLIITKTSSNEVISKIENRFKNFFKVDKIDVQVLLKYCVLSVPNDATDFDKIMTTLSQMMYIEEIEYSNIVYFKENLNHIFDRQMEIELSLEKSLINREFNVVFQPIVLQNHPETIRGFEALARWNHPFLNNISPDEFIPILEKTHKVHRLDHLIIFEAIKVVKGLSKKYDKDFVLSCNVSVETISRDGFSDYIKQTLSKFDYNPNYLEIEITESTIMKDPDKVIAIINELTSYGVRFSQDDFGDGFSSLNYLTKLNISTLKLSKNLIDGITKGYNSRLLINTIIELAHELGFEVIVEGVETVEVVKILEDFNCDYIQGYYYHKPLSFNEVDKLVKNKKVN
jgi:diguanylate cyclase (GGDEF)-like protein